MTENNIFALIVLGYEQKRKEIERYYKHREDNKI